MESSGGAPPLLLNLVYQISIGEIAGSVRLLLEEPYESLGKNEVSTQYRLGLVGLM